jgi:Ca2+-binding RTX toxin-like protein
MAHGAVAKNRRHLITPSGTQEKEPSMMRSVFGRNLGIGRSDQIGRDHKRRARQMEARVEGLESRNLMTAGSVVLTPGLVTVTPSSTGPNTAIVSYQNVTGTTMLDVNLNGNDHYFSVGQVGFVYYMGSGSSGTQTFQNSTSLHSVAWGGSGTNVFEGSTGQDEFFGGSGSNTFDAGSGYDVLIGGTGTNVVNENATGSGVIVEVSRNTTINVPPGHSGSYQIF